MRELIKITTNEQGSQVVSARDLHEFLEIKKPITQWFEYQAERAMLIEKEDFLTILLESTGGRQSKDYAISLSAAKEIAMLNGGIKGKQARQYFIECERKLKEAYQQPTPVSIEDALIQQLQLTKAIRLEQEQIKDRLTLIEAKTTTRPEYFTVMGYAVIKGTKVGLSLAAQLGRKAKQICQTKGYHIDKIYDPRFGRVGCYPASVLQEVFNTTML